MGGISDYALEVATQRKGRRPQKDQQSKHVPAALQETRIRAKLAECVKNGMCWKDAEADVLAWNAEQPSPMKISKVKSATYHAYHPEV